MSRHEGGPIRAPHALGAVTTFFERLSRDCASVDFDATEPMFAADVRAFGTRAEVVVGRERLRREQWQGIWPRIADFRVLLDQVHAAGDERFAWGMAPWRSTGFDRDGEPFDRPGRATVVLERRGDRWEVVHTHFSLAPGTPHETFGARAE